MPLHCEIFVTQSNGRPRSANNNNCPVVMQQHLLCVTALIVILLSALSAGLVPDGGPARLPNPSATNSQHLAPVSKLVLQQWVDSAFQLVRSINCSRQLITSRKECARLSRRFPTLHLSSNVYYSAVGQQSRSDKLRVVYPDSDAARVELHDSVIAIDPYPEASFGHLVFVFYVDLDRTDAWCERVDSLRKHTGELR